MRKVTTPAHHAARAAAEAIGVEAEVEAGAGHPTTPGQEVPGLDQEVVPMMRGAEVAVVQ